MTHRVRKTGVAIAAFFTACFAVFAASEHGLMALVAWAATATLAGIFGARLIKERQILRDPVGTDAAVTTISTRPLEAAFVYSTRFRFTAADGRTYSGKSDWVRNRPEGETPIRVAYRANDPKLCLPVEDFRFFDVVEGPSTQLA